MQPNNDAANSTAAPDDTADGYDVRDRQLVSLFDDGPRVRILSVLLDAEQPLNPTRIQDRAEISAKTWYNHRDDLLDTGLVREVGQAGNSPLYAMPDREEDPRVTALQQLVDYTAAYRRQGSEAFSADE